MDYSTQAVVVVDIAIIGVEPGIVVKVIKPGSPRN
jgi:hypothetical protein